MTSEADRHRLLEIARRAIVAHVTGDIPPTAVDVEAGDPLHRPGAAFVTIHCQKDLRGCIGHLEPNDLLPRVVASCAVAAASADPRFPPIGRDELSAIDIEISVLGPFEPIASAEDIEIGRHGLLIEKGWQRGLLLPQVATEWQWDRDTFLVQTCRKAGLPRDAWRNGASLWRFEAEVFGDDATAR
jgi:AmmeMemoRadiSam system protein A